MYLAIDTSTGTAGIAIVAEGEILAELNWRCGQNHSTQLLPRLSDLLTETGLKIQSAQGIIVAKGPGSYNGLRVGISTAKGLAFSLDVPIIGISTLSATAYAHAASGFQVCPVLDARRGEIAAAIYQQKNRKWQRIVTEHITTVENLCSQITTTTIFCGEHIPVIASYLKKQLGGNVIIPSPAARMRRAAFLAELGISRLEKSDCDNPATLQPTYLRGPAITKAKHF
ncbi:tRNA (adenosine(37)-N6)-threonylcarbamoyltransferase complex dimerization subunit type 1 TsaB [Chloroflexota bacterium]